jgi:hypothetical protein
LAGISGYVVFLEMPAMQRGHCYCSFAADFARDHRQGVSRAANDRDATQGVISMVLRAASNSLSQARLRGKMSRFG